eukprot:COSAG01_NODE_4046_length_5403_cov_7.683446_5_plen_384_part_00
MECRRPKRRRKALRNRITVVEEPCPAAPPAAGGRRREAGGGLLPAAGEAPVPARARPAEALRQELGVVVARGRCPCAPIEALGSLQGIVSKLLLERLTGLYTRPTPVQAQTWPLGLRGADVIAVAQTGSGKTCAYLLPAVEHILRAPVLSMGRAAPVAMTSTAAAAPPLSALPPVPGAPPGSWKCSSCGNVNYPLRDKCNTRSCKSVRPVAGAADPGQQAQEPAAALSADPRTAMPRALVLAPTRELAQQIAAEAERLSAGLVRTSCIYGGVGKGAQAAQLRDDGGCQLLVATPGRCLDFLAYNQLIGLPLSLEQVTFLVLDEADRMLEAGFQKEMTTIGARPALANTSRSSPSLCEMSSSGTQMQACVGSWRSCRQQRGQSE